MIALTGANTKSLQGAAEMTSCVAVQAGMTAPSETDSSGKEFFSSVLERLFTFNSSEGQNIMGQEEKGLASGDNLISETDLPDRAESSVAADDTVLLQCAACSIILTGLTAEEATVNSEVSLSDKAGMLGEVKGTKESSLAFCSPKAALSSGADISGQEENANLKGIAQPANSETGTFLPDQFFAKPETDFSGQLAYQKQPSAGTAVIAESIGQAWLKETAKWSDEIPLAGQAGGQTQGYAEEVLTDGRNPANEYIIKNGPSKSGEPQVRIAEAKPVGQAYTGAGDQAVLRTDKVSQDLAADTDGQAKDTSTADSFSLKRMPEAEKNSEKADRAETEAVFTLNRPHTVPIGTVQDKNSVVNTDKVDVAAQVESGISSMLKPNGETCFKMKLYPEGLGEVRVTLTCQDSKVSLEILTDNPQAQKLLSGQAGELKAALAAKNYEVSSLSVNAQAETAGLANGGFSFLGRQMGGNFGSWQQSVMQGTVSEANTLAEDAAAEETWSNRGTGRLNIRI